MRLTAPHDSADWPFIQNGAVTLFLKQPVLESAVKMVSSEGYAVHQIDCETDEVMLQNLTVALRWQEQFGYAPTVLNLDALNDALRGMPCDDCPSVVLVLTHFQAFCQRNEDAAHAVLDIIESQSRDHLLFGRKLLAFVHTTDPVTYIENLGGRVAQWNPEEWLMQSRGV